MKSPTVAAACTCIERIRWVHRLCFQTSPLGNAALCAYELIHTALVAPSVGADFCRLKQIVREDSFVGSTAFSLVALRQLADDFAEEIFISCSVYITVWGLEGAVIWLLSDAFDLSSNPSDLVAYIISFLLILYSNLYIYNFRYSWGGGGCP